MIPSVGTQRHVPNYTTVVYLEIIMVSLHIWG